MRQTMMSKPPPYSGKDFKGMTPLAKFHGRREARVKSRREAHAVISEQVESAYEPPRDWAAEWEQAASADLYAALDNYPCCGGCTCCGHNDGCEVLVEFAAMAHFFDTGEFLPV